MPFYRVGGLMVHIKLSGPKSKQPKCLRITRSGYPQHPLMLPSSCRLQPFDLTAIEEAMHA